MGISDETRISELGIHCSRPNLDSGIFRVVQYRSSTRVGDREKAGMTVFTAVYKGRRNRLIQAFFTLPLFFFVYSVVTCCAAGDTSSGRSPGRSIEAFGNALFPAFCLAQSAFSDVP